MTDDIYALAERMLDPHSEITETDICRVARALLDARAEIERLKACIADAEEGWHLANGCADLAMKHRDVAEAREAKLREALRRLINEVMAGWSVDQAAIREIVGHTNYNILQERLSEARAALHQDEGGPGRQQEIELARDAAAAAAEAGNVGGINMGES